jgi:DNA polymerase I
MQKILLVDTYNMIHRSRFGWNRGPDSITFNFFRSLKSEIDRHMPDKVYIVSEGTPKSSLKINPDYKGNRTKVLDDSFYKQKKDIFSICENLPITFIRHPDFECDDVISHLTVDIHKSDEVIICSSDTDFIQLIDNNVRLWNPIKKKFIEPWPVDYVVWKSLTGDKTDNVAGIKGVGQKTALKLASNLDNLEKFLDKGDNREIFDNAYLQIKLKKISLNDKTMQEYDYTFRKKNLLEEFSSRKFNSIISKSWEKWINTMETLNEKRTIIC